MCKYNIIVGWVLGISTHLACREFRVCTPNLLAYGTAPTISSLLHSCPGLATLLTYLITYWLHSSGLNKILSAAPTSCALSFLFSRLR